jgi:hypothetical protein
VTVTLALIDYLRAQGMPPEQILEAVSTVERAREIERWAYEAPAVDEAAQRRRAADRERKRVRRMSAENPQTSADDPEQRKPPTPPKENNIPPDKPNGLSTPKTSKGTRLADDWQPPEALLDFGRSLGFSDAAARSEMDRMADHFRSAPGQRGVKRDWIAAGKNWFRTAAERKGVAPTTTGPAAPVAIEIRAGEASWDAWRAFYRDRDRKFSIKTMDQAAEGGKAFSVPTLWPPA